MLRHLTPCLLLPLLALPPAAAQSVCLPAPRLLTTMPMGGQVGTQVDVVISGDSIADASELLFSHPGITATAKVDEQGKPVANQYVVSIADDCPAGIQDARVMTPMGLSSPRAFTVGTLQEVVQSAASPAVDSAFPLELNSICNATMPARAINHYRFEAAQGQRILVDCAASGIDSKLNAVLIVADAQGRDLVVQRLGDLIDFTVPEDGEYLVKVHDMTFKGGAEYFYRLAVQQVSHDAPAARQPATRSVQAFSWPPTDLATTAATVDTEPNNAPEKAQAVTLPLDVAGSFYPAADIDSFEFDAQQGEVWWVEVASARLGFPTDPAVLIQRVEAAKGSTTDGTAAAETLVDVVELSDISSPVKVSSNGYAYDGPPYNAGSPDVLGKFEVPQDGRYRLQLTDLFGGTRSDPRNAYRLIVRKAEPDFAVVAWALHMQLRNGDRNALSKPIALRPGATMALEVVVVRRDGFDGEIELFMEDLPAGVSACGLKIAACKSRGMMLLTAAEDAPSGFSNTRFFARAEINGTPVTHDCHLASMAWPLKDSWREIPSPRLVASVPVSISAAEQAPLSIASLEQRVWEATAGQAVTIPLAHHRRREFSGSAISMKTIGAGFDNNPKFDLPLQEDHSEVVLDLAKLKTPPGEYRIAFYGSAVAKVENKDIVDIVVSEPITIRVQPAETK
ncbi:serine protease [Roseimaritima ulvae]|uniref:Subtilase-type serine protease n=1 Tax=Roseimaritima ulvae TaxID=980254 RepID=A0A5B9QLJ7_9BACT|nr:serine protease [Roseimaritima ulvae]QEG38682.1 hypothetical protein UC8_06400 [Roseimaritima ulvae]